MDVRTSSLGTATRLRDRRRAPWLARTATLGALWLVGCGGGGGGAAPIPTGLVDGPIVGRVSASSATIAWRTGAPEVGRVELGLDATYGDTASEVSATTEHRVVLEGLGADTTHHYRIAVAGGGDPEALADHTVHTAPRDSGEHFRFAVVGDSGSGSPEESAIVELIDAAQPELVLHTGDIAYGAGTNAQVEARFLAPYEPLLDHVPVYASLGNHDAATDGGAPLLAATVLPTNDVDGSSHFYSYDWGGVHFVALDSNQSLAPGSAQLAWLDADLAASSADWRVLFFHHPPYSSSKHGSNEALRAALTPVLDRHHVDLVFNGHDHDYERTLPMASGAVADPSLGPDYVDAAGTVFVVTGGGGQALYAAGASAFTASSESSFHFVQVDVDGGALAVTAIRIDGSVLDRFSLAKSG